MTSLKPIVEMKDSGFQFIGMIPNDWDVRRGKTILSVINRPVNEDDGVVTCFRDGEVTLRVNRRVEGFTNSDKEIGYQGVEPGDLVVHGMDGFAGSIGISDSRGKMSPIIIVLESSENKKYLMYYLRAMAFREVFLALSTGIRVRSCDLRWNKLAVFPFVIPNKKEQRAIADYLDDHCSKLDEIITEAEKSIEEYKELKQAVIFEAVTKGLDKNVSMRDSGVEWLPRVPASWDVRRIASIYEESKETGRDDLPILLVSIHTGISDREIDDEERDRKVIRSEDKTVYKVVHKNYLAYNMMRAWQGGFGAAIVDGLVSPAYVVAKPKIEVNSSYVEHVLRTPNAIEHIRGLSYGVADFRLRLYWPYFKNIKIPLPPIEEQNKIVSYIQDQSNKMDALISEKQSLIEDLKAYKKSLIYEVVTGKRRVV